MSNFAANTTHEYKEKYRLQLHYSPSSGWMNDPNGLIYANDVYHMFYQYYPNDTKWGPMHWGHATSKDLIHWQTLPIALEPYEKGSIFSGSAVHDANNVTGLARSADESLLIAVYTLNHEATMTQSQALAYSHDHGVTWNQFENNPVIPNPGIKDFRDPNFIKRGNVFILTLAAGSEVMIYSSLDLKHWTSLSSFGEKSGDHSGDWECPALVKLSVKDGSSTEAHDILIVSENSEAAGSRTQYFIGSFDGKVFKNGNEEQQVLWLDNGRDNYAAIPYHNDPEGRVIIIGWMSNWLYAQDVPTATWRSQMTIPRELSLKRVDGRLHLKQEPIREFYSLMDQEHAFELDEYLNMRGTQTIDLASELGFKSESPLLLLEYKIALHWSSRGKVGIRFANEKDEWISFCYNISSNVYQFDRRHTHVPSFNPKYPGDVVCFDRIEADNTFENGKVLTATVILDVASIEVFADDGINTMTALFFSNDVLNQVQITVEGVDTPITVKEFKVTPLRSIWKANQGQ